MSAKRTPNIVATAPERIYLVVGEDVDKSTDFADLCGEGITWCEDKIDGNSIEYVRADKNAAPPESALQRLTEAGEIQAAMERIATLEAALHLAFAKMDRARDILTDGKPRIDCNWGMLATEAIKHGLGWPIDRAALAGNPAPRLTDDDFLQIIFSCGSELQDRKALTYDSGPYEVSTLTAAGSRLCRAIEAKVRGE